MFARGRHKVVYELVCQLAARVELACLDVG
jgi:hypothetical protein